MDTTTRENLLTALHGEAFAYARYSLFAAAARGGGDEKLATLYEGMANVELHEHFAELAELAGIVGADTDNVAEAIQDENVESEVTYPAFAAQARAVGDVAAADRFEELAGDEAGHARALEGVLERLELPA